MSGGTGMRSGSFEGSYLGTAGKISALALMECKVCWTPYDPASGDETRQIEPGTPFRDLPEDWKCPNCDSPKEQFMVLEDPGLEASDAAAEEGRVEGAGAAVDERTAMQRAVSDLEAEFREIHAAKMRDTPFTNKALSVETVAFTPWSGRYLGVLMTPWFMNLVILPGPQDDWSGLKTGVKETIAFPSGAYEFIHNVREMSGGYKACSLFSPMSDFNSQLQATDVARVVMAQLFNPENRAETDRSDEIRAERVAQLEAEREAEEAGLTADAEPIAVSRRALLGAAPRGDEADTTPDEIASSAAPAPDNGDGAA